MLISQVEKLIGLPKHTIMYYEKEGLISPRRDKNGYRHFEQNDIQILEFIKKLRDMQLTIDEIKSILNQEISVREILEAKEQELGQRIAELERSQKRIASHKGRQKVYIAFHNEVIENKRYECLYFNETEIRLCDTYLLLDEIKNIYISMCSYVSLIHGFTFTYCNYYVDIDIETAVDTYSFQLMNEEKTKLFFDYLKEHTILYTDVLHLEDIYDRYTDSV